MAELVTIRIRLDHLGQIADGLEVLLEQWEATRAYWAGGTVPEDGCIRECSDLEEAEWTCAYYREILASVWESLEATQKREPK
jgi:hypothetical protein